MFKKTVNKALAMAIIVTILLALILPSILADEYSEVSVFATYESDDFTYPSDAEEYIYPAPVIPEGFEVATEIEEVGRDEEEVIEVMPANELIMTYSNLVAAIAAADDGDTIVLGADINAEGHTAIPINTNLTLTSELDNNFIFTVTTGRHFVVNNDASLRLENVTLRGDLSVVAAHGGVQVNAEAHLYLAVGSIIENSRAISGGGVQLNDGILTINGGEIRNNTSTATTAANNGGGGVNAVGAHSRVYLYRGTISGNIAVGTVNTIGGGGVRIDGGEFVMRGGIISNNTVAGRYGGGVAIAGGGILRMENGTITENSARAGGGINLGNPSSAGSFTMTGGTISRNIVTGIAGDDGGGGVRLNNPGSRFYMYNGEIADHEIARDGGGVRATSGTIYLLGGEISNNRVTDNRTGGGLHIANGTLIMSNGLVRDNQTLGTAAAHGAGMHLVSSTFTMSGGEISNNQTSGSGNGGGIHMTGASSTITLSGDAAIFGNEANQGGGLNIEVGSGLFTPFTMSGGLIEDNTARTNGGGMRISGAQLTMTGGMIHDNTAGHAGGGIHFATHALSRVFLYEGAVISENDSGTVAVGVIARDGGGINMTGGRAYLRGGEISGNTAYGSGANAGQGGGVNLRSGSAFTIESGTITGNEAHLGGGLSIFSIGGTFADIIMYDGEISGNTARDQGGGLNVNQGSFEMFDGTIEDNTSLSHGGGLRMSGNGLVDIHNGDLRNNTANGNGGAIHIGTGNTAGGLLHIRENALIIENTAVGLGGGVNFSGGSLRLLGTVSDNESGHDGGGLELSSSSDTIHNVEIDGALFSGNRSGGAGGAINTQRVNINNTHTFIIQNTELVNNHARSRGGGMRIGYTGDITFNDVIIDGNSTYGNGGGIFIGSSFFSTLYINDGVRISENIGNHGGGMYQHGGTVHMHGAEIRDNIAHINGGGVTLNNAAGSSAGSFTMHDGIIYHNTAGNNGGGMHARSANSIFNMLDGSIQGNTAGNGGGMNVGSSFINIHNGEISNNTARNNGGGMWFALHDNPVNVHSGEFTDNIAGGDGGAIFVSNTRTDNPLAEAVNVYPRLHLIGNSVIFSDNTAGGGEFAPPDNYYKITRFNGQLMTNYNINYRSNWRVIFLLNGGNIDGNEGPIEEIFQTDWTPEQRRIGDGRVPGPPVQEGNTFIGWRNRDSEPEWDEHWNGILPDHYIWSDERVAAHVVDSSTVFEAIWERRIYTVTYTIVGLEPADFTPALDTLGGTYPMGDSVTVADELIATTNLYVDGTTLGTWIFVGWSRAEENLDVGETFIMPGEDVLLVGTWVFEAFPTVSFEFHKTGEDLYNMSEWNNPGWLDTILRAGAHFSLFRYTGEGTPPSGIITDAMVTAGTWEYVGSDISSGIIGIPIEFQLILGQYYHLVETLPPPGYTLPLGQWRIVAVMGGEDEEEIGFQITYEGVAPPAFANIGGQFEEGAHFGGTLFVGNQLEFILPIFGGSGISIVVMFVGLLTIMATFGFSLWYMMKKKKD